MDKHQKIVLIYTNLPFLYSSRKKKRWNTSEVFFDVFREYRKNTGIRKQTDIDVLRFFDESHSSLIMEKIVIFVIMINCFNFL